MLPKRIAVALLSLSLIVAACGSNSETSESAPTSESGPIGSQQQEPASTQESEADEAPATSGATTPAATAEGDSDEPTGGSIVYAAKFEPAGGILDPHKMARSVDFHFAVLNYEPLIATSNEGALEPGLAETWELSDDGLTLTMQLRSGVVFHDGATFDAAAAKLNLERAKLPDMPSSELLGAIDSIEANGDLELVLHLNRPGVALMTNLAGFPGMMISPAAFDDPNLSSTPVGAGPYVLAERSENLYVYEKFENYWNADAIDLDTITLQVIDDATARYNALVSGQVDVAGITPDRVADAESNGLHVATRSQLNPNVLTVVTSSPGLDQGLVRRAMSHAVDRDGINQAIFNGTCQPTAQIYPEWYWAHDPDIDYDEYASYDPERARQLLAEAGYPDGFSMEIVAPANYEPLTRLTEVLQAQLGEVGIDVGIISLATTEFTPAFLGGQGDALSAVVLADLEPTVTFDQYYLPNERRRHLDDPPGVAALIDQARGESDQDVRAGIIHEATSLMLDYGLPTVTLCHQTEHLAYRDGIEGVEIQVRSTGFEPTSIRRVP